MKTKSWTPAGTVLFASVFTLALLNCNKSSGGGNNPPAPNPPTPPVVTPVQSDVTLYLTNADQTALFQRQNVTLAFSSTITPGNTIEVDTTQTFQQMDGFGYTLTGGSATLINSLPASTQESLLKDMFLWDSTF